jgi:hypothetical protein
MYRNFLEKPALMIAKAHWLSIRICTGIGRPKEFSTIIPQWIPIFAAAIAAAISDSPVDVL